MQKTWNQFGNVYQPGAVASQTPVLPNGLYTLKASMEGLYLEGTGELFEFNHKIYGTQQEFIDWVLKTYAGTRGNLGVLMNGLKGTGKSVTLKQLANALNQPVIVINTNFGGAMIDFLANLEQDVTIVFDEFEKIFAGENGKSNSNVLLSVMDGVLGTGARKVFLCTTNDINIDKNMLERPGRFRYIKTFGNLNPEQIAEIVDDKLVHKELRDKTIQDIAKLNLITVDIVCAVINEVNIHGVAPEAFLEFFNVKKNDPKWDIYRSKIVSGKPGEEKLLSAGATAIMPVESLTPEMSVYYNRGNYLGDFVKAVEGMEEVFIIQKYETAPKGTPEDQMDRDGEILVQYQIRYEKVDSYNSAYSRYAF